MDMQGYLAHLDAGRTVVGGVPARVIKHIEA